MWTATAAATAVGSGDWLGIIVINSTLLASDEKADDTQKRSANHHEYPMTSDHKRA
jgi:hypothetical protein